MTDGLAGYKTDPLNDIEKAARLSDLDLKKEYYRLQTFNSGLAQIYGDEIAARKEKENSKTAKWAMWAAIASAISAFLQFLK